MGKVITAEDIVAKPLYLSSVSDLEMTARTTNRLREENINFVYQLAQQTENLLRRVPNNMSKKSIAEINEKLKVQGIELGSTLADGILPPGQTEISLTALRARIQILNAAEPKNEDVVHMMRTAATEILRGFGLQDGEVASIAKDPVLARSLGNYLTMANQFQTSGVSLDAVGKLYPDAPKALLALNTLATINPPK